MLRFSSRNYRPDNAIFFVYGHIDFKQIIKLLKKQDFGLFEISDKTNSDCILSPYQPTTLTIEKDTHQSHVMLGTRAYDIHHPLRIPLYLLNNILGGPGLNARLNLSLRERNGLVYTVESMMVSYGDTGMWSVYFGCDPHDVKKCLRLVRRELDKMMQKPLSAIQLRNAKRQLKGQIAIACDNHEQFALDFGKSFLHYGWEKDITHLYDSIDKVTSEDIQKVANELFATERLTTLIFK